ncbi:hypothetical protein LCGC14_1970830, partial [marine sediment metagenome]
MSKVIVKQNDFGYYLNFTVQNHDGTVFNLAGYTITLNVWRESRFPIILLAGACGIVVAADGTCRYLVVTGDFPDEGMFKYELEMTAVGENISTSTGDFTVRES